MRPNDFAGVRWKIRKSTTLLRHVLKLIGTVIGVLQVDPLVLEIVLNVFDLTLETSDRYGELALTGVIKLVPLGTHDMVSDVLTKILTVPSQRSCVSP